MNQPAFSNQPPNRSRSTERHHDLMQLFWDRMGDFFGLQIWTDARGGIDGEVFASWSTGLQNYNREQIARGLGHCQNWQKDRPPTLEEFQALCLVETRQPKKAQPPPSQSIKAREEARQQRLARSPKSRQPSPDDVETFEEAYRNCGLNRRWSGKGPVL